MIKGIIDKIYNFCQRKKLKSYFVGGFLRDLLLNKETKDIDVVISTSDTVCKIAKEFSYKIRGSLVRLDEKNDIYRVVYNKRIYVDFSKMRGGNIENDLVLRDFTINAMAIPVVASVTLFSNNKGIIIDPCKGLRDLKRQTIRMVTRLAFKEDPLRLLRAYRLAAVLNFKIENSTKRLIKQESFLISEVAKERIRDELLKILGVRKSYRYICSLEKVGLLSEIFPEVNMMKEAVDCYYHRQGLWEHSRETLNSMEEIFLKLDCLFPKIYNNLTEYLEEEVAGDIKRKVVLKIGALFHDLGKPATLKIVEGRVRFLGHEAEGAKLAKNLLRRLKLSNRLIKNVEKIILHHMRPGNLSSVSQLTDRAIWRFFTDLKEEGIDTLLISLADRYSYRKVQAREDEMRKQQVITKKMLENFYQRRQQIFPKPLIKGDDLIRIFGFSEGPQIGKFLKIIGEAQAGGEVKTQEEAIEFIKKILEETT